MRSTCPKEGHKFGLFVSLGQLNIRIFFNGFRRCFQFFFSTGTLKKFMFDIFVVV